MTKTGKTAAPRKPRLTNEQKRACLDWMLDHHDEVEDKTIAQLTEDLENLLDLMPDTIATSAVRSLLTEHSKEHHTANAPPAVEATNGKHAPSNGNLDIRGMIRQICQEVCDETVPRKLQELLS